MSFRTFRIIARKLNCRSPINRRWKSDSKDHITKSGQNDKDEEVQIDESALPPEPTYCCNSGCANCVWIKYAQEVAQLFDNGDAIAKKKIEEKVHDPKLRAFLFMQLGLKDDDKK